MKSKSMKSMVQEIYECPDCGYTFPVWRSRGGIREMAHQKWLFCVKCGMDKDFVKKG